MPNKEQRRSSVTHFRECMHFKADERQQTFCSFLPSPSLRFALLQRQKKFQEFLLFCNNHKRKKYFLKTKKNGKKNSEIRKRRKKNNCE